VTLSSPPTAGVDPHAFPLAVVLVERLVARDSFGRGRDQPPHTFLRPIHCRNKTSIGNSAVGHRHQPNPALLLGERKLE